MIKYIYKSEKTLALSFIYSRYKKFKDKYDEIALKKKKKKKIN